MDQVNRMCRNCYYFPCVRGECFLNNDKACLQHRFEHEVLNYNDDFIDALRYAFNEGLKWKKI